MKPSRLSTRTAETLPPGTFEPLRASFNFRTISHSTSVSQFCCTRSVYFAFTSNSCSRPHRRPFKSGWQCANPTSAYLPRSVSYDIFFPNFGLAGFGTEQSQDTRTGLEQTPKGVIRKKLPSERVGRRSAKVETEHPHEISRRGQ